MLGVSRRGSERWSTEEAREARDVASRLATRQTVLTLGRVVLPAVLASALGFSYYDNLSKYIAENWLDEGSISFLSSDDIQYLPSFLQVISLLFSILAGNAYSSLYSQQEDIFFALYREVSDAKSLLEQMALVCSGRPFYLDALRMLQSYVATDLRRLDLPPAELVARSPSEDPLEAIMYLTSVGVPSVVYETVRDLRQARGQRLGAMQRKFPALGIALLYILALLELVAFPVLGAGTAVGAPPGIFTIQAALFGGLCGATILVLRIIQELRRTSGGAFNVDAVLAKMVSGLNDDLELRAALASRDSYASSDALDTIPRGIPRRNPDDLVVNRLSRLESDIATIIQQKQQQQKSTTLKDPPIQQDEEQLSSPSFLPSSQQVDQTLISISSDNNVNEDHIAEQRRRKRFGWRLALGFRQVRRFINLVW
mmetsp:Transcript_10899/g.16420  ORF Transcript_10899/g.16420 Transcript_10899/m.16420 type:complete len:427 (-) Transcript_10899:194-1474(-)